MEHPDQPPVDAQQTGTSDTNQAFRAARRQMIKSAVAAMPVVLTVAAGTAHAQASGSNPMSGGAGLQAPPEGGELLEGPNSIDQMLNSEPIDASPQLNSDGSVPPVN